ncbi:alpha-E domain-containing protein [Paenibacillus sp. NPDC056579]|uniref:alpha-E domain-containing protein n=1 Tax=Paenibacillus sp. NPDC056579 TaxID=3345871 RepID=UPI0036C43DE6
MLNRNAEALFWVGRYIERAENHARLIDVHYHIQHEGDFDNEANKWERLIDTLGARTDYLQQFDLFTQKDVLSFITLDRGYTNSLFSCVSQARGNLRTLREKLPSELWEVLNAFYLWLGEKQVDDILQESPHPFYKQIKERSAMFYGVQQSVMPRENEWHFMESGRYLERAENTVRILQSVLGAIREDQAPAYPYLLAVLKSVSGYQTFRKYYADKVTVEPIMEFLIGNAEFPRSIQFSFERLEEHMGQMELASFDLNGPRDKAIRQAGKLKADLACLEREDMALPLVQPLLDGLMQSCGKLGRAMAAAFFHLEEVGA